MTVLHMHVSFFVEFRFVFIHLSLAALGLCCFVRAVFSCGEWGLLELHCAASQCGGFSCEAQALGVQSSVVAERRLRSCSWLALEPRLSYAA